MQFDQLGLCPEILKSLEKSGYTTPSEIQSHAIPKIHEGVDLRASAQTGTGKTAAFLLPTIHRLVTTERPNGQKKGPRALILTPTRELAIQVSEQAKKYSQHAQRVSVVSVCGGVPYFKERKLLCRPFEILVATPGRLVDYIKQKKIDLSALEVLVLDEADRMLDMGFTEPVEFIVSHLPKNRQTLLFSATLKGQVAKLANKILNNPVDIEIHSTTDKHDNIEQVLHYTDDLNHKNKLLKHLLDLKEARCTIVFTSTKRHADQLVRELGDQGRTAMGLHGDMSQSQRTRTIKKFREGKANVLVATDVAARGLDVNSVTHVINFDLPRQVEDYVHRIGRTGRAGAQGTALSFASPADKHLVQRIEKFTGHPIGVKEVEGLEPSKKARSNKTPFKPRNNRFAPKRGNFGKKPQQGRFSPRGKKSYR